MALSIREFADKVCDIIPVIIKELAKQEIAPYQKKAVTLPQLLVLSFLSSSGAAKMKDIASFMGVTTADMTGVVEKLVRHGYAQRIAEPADRRIVKIRLTPCGGRAVRHLMEKRKQITMRIFGMISQREREDYLKILTHLHQHLKNGAKTDET